MARFLYECTKPVTTNDALRNPVVKLLTGHKWLALRRATMAVGVIMAGIICRVIPNAKTPDMHYCLRMVSADDRGKKQHPIAGFTVLFYSMRPSSRGHVLIISKDTHEPPVIQPNYLRTNYDRNVLINGAKMALRLARTAAMSD